MDTNASPPLFRADHVKKHSYHLIIHRNHHNEIDKSCEDIVDNHKDVFDSHKNENYAPKTTECDYSVAVLGQLGYVLDYGDIKSKGSRWREDKILKRFKNDIKLDDQAVNDVSLDVEAEFISQRFYLNSIRSTSKNSSTIKNIDINNGHTFNTDVNDLATTANNTDDCNANVISDCVNGDVKYVLDCTCGIGGNLIPIAANFICIGVELSPQRCEICKHNLKVYGLDNRAVVVNTDITTFLDSINFNDPQSFKDFGIDVTKPPFDKLLKQKFSWTIISPPWGSTNYPGCKETTITYRLRYITSIDIKSVVTKAAAVSNNVSLMLPRSQNIPDLIHLSQLTNLPFVTIDLLYKSTRNPLPRLCYVHLTSQLMDKCGPVKRRKVDMERWDIADITECVYIAVPINYNQGKINLISPLSTNSMFNDIKTPSFTRALGESILSAINEPIHSLPRLINIIEIIGTKEIQSLLQDTNRIYHSCGMKYDLDGITKSRTFGGIFFYLFKTRHRMVYRQVEKQDKLRKLRKQH